MTTPSVCTECGYNLPHHGRGCPDAPRTTTACPDHAPAGAARVPNDDGRPRCATCGVTGGHVGIFLV